jgi:2-keto-3-deoxy-L-rhamnonate aldolase RhmA
MALNVTYNFKKRLAKGDIVYGQTIGPGNDPDKTVKALKNFGFDFIMMENEHSLLDKETIYRFIKAAREYEMPIWLRPEENSANFRCFLDAGINCLMLPQTDTAEEAEKAVSKAYFPPLGNRGSGIGMSPYLLDGQDPEQMPLRDVMDYVNNNVGLFPQTETLKAIGNLPRILSIEGITGTMVGTNDLVIDIGDIPPKALRGELVSTPFIESKLREIARICKAAGKFAGIGGFGPKGLSKWAKEGYQLFTLGYVIDGNVDKLKPKIDEMKELVAKVMGK